MGRQATGGGRIMGTRAGWESDSKGRDSKWGRGSNSCGGRVMATKGMGWAEGKGRGKARAGRQGSYR